MEFSERLSKFIEQAKRWPWRVIAAFGGGGFLLAAITSMGIAFVLMPSTTNQTSVPTGRGSTSINIPANPLSLDKKAVDAILARNIFNHEGDTGEEEGAGIPVEEVKVTDEILKTDLPLILLGTIAAGEANQGIAVIQNTSKNTINSFMVGDPLQRDALLLEIHYQRIIIDRGSRKEFLEVEKTELVRSTRKKSAADLPKAPVSTDDAPIATDPPPETYKEVGFERKGTEITMSKEYRQRLLGPDFAKVLQDAKATPHMVENEMRGFRLEKIRKDSAYEKSGLRNGDIIEEINGVPLTDAGQAIKLLNSLRGEGEIEARLSRGGSPVTISIRVP